MRGIYIICLLLCFFCPPKPLFAQGKTNNSKTDDLSSKVEKLEKDIVALKKELYSLKEHSVVIKKKQDSPTKVATAPKAEEQAQSKNESKYSLVGLALITILAGGIAYGSYHWYRKRSNDQEFDEDEEEKEDDEGLAESEEQSLAKRVREKGSTSTNKSKVLSQEEPVANDKKNEVMTEVQEDLQASTGWTVLHASQIGASHISAKLPCQDYSIHEALDSGWGICVVSDGAGSASHSHVGSESVCFNALRETKEFLHYGKFIEQARLPEDNIWQQAAQRIMHNIKKHLDSVARSWKVDLKDVSATCMIAVYSPHGVLTTHIGDGRGGYHDNTNGEWLPLFRPHKGEEANQTLFITSAWEGLAELGGVLVPESHVYRGDIDALCLLSDGMEKASFECSVLNKETECYEDLNRPSAKVFGVLVKVVRESKARGGGDDQLHEKWKQYLSQGTPSIAREADDKTMLLAVRHS